MENSHTFYLAIFLVVDGNPFIILDEDNTQVRIRLYGIDCTENYQDFGTVAKKFTADHCFQRIVDIEVKDIDRYTAGLLVLFFCLTAKT